MARIDWNNITFTGKDLIAYGSVCFAISGLYYKSIITDAENKKTTSEKVIIQDQRITDVESKFKKMEEDLSSVKKELRILQDNDLKRSTLESSGGYLPFKKK